MRPLTWPYKLALAFLYNQFTWINRPLGPNTALQVVPTAKFCSHFKITSTRLHSYLDKMHDLGLVAKLEWHSHYFIIQPAQPVGYAQIVGTDETSN